MITQKIIISILTIFYAYLFSLVLKCQGFTDRFHFTLLDAHLKTEEAIRNDVGYAPELARFFHNKISIYGTEFLKRYFQFWHVPYDVLVFSIVGCIGVLYGFWYLIQQKRRKTLNIIILTMLLVLPIIEVLQLPIPKLFRIALITLPYYCFSLFGLWQFMKQFKMYGTITIVVLLVLSIWYLSVFQSEMQMYCRNA